MKNYLSLLRERVVVFDGATGTNLQRLSLNEDDFGGAHLEGCNEILVRTRPDAIRELHCSFLDVGVDVVETNTFGSFAVPLGEYGLANETYDLNRTAASLATEVARSYDPTTTGAPRFVAGSMGPGTKMPTLGHIPFAELRDAYEIQAQGLLDGGIDLFIIETQFDLLGAKAAMIACRRAMQAIGRTVPLQVQVTMEATGRMLPGTEIGAAWASIRAMRPDVFGLNCATGPEEMNEHLRYLQQHADAPIAVLPNAGLPSVVDGAMHYDLTPEDFATHLTRFVADYGIRVVGGCCGTTPEHLRQLVDRLATTPRASTPLTSAFTDDWRSLPHKAALTTTPSKGGPEQEPEVTSLYSPVSLRQELSYLAIGERTNANGSKKFREAMLAGDYETCVAMAREQIKQGAHVLDVCVDYVGRDGTADMHEIAKRFATEAAAPLVLDSTEPQVLEAGLQHLGGRAILNSANLEDGEAVGSRMDRVFSLAQEYGAAVICLLIDEQGQARDVEWKLRIAHRLYQIATKRYGLSAGDLLFDALTFPLSTGDPDLANDAAYTIEAIRRIKEELPGVGTVLGVSNVSFGLGTALRHTLNSVFLYEAQKAGLDAAIVHAAKVLPLHSIDPEVRKLCEDLVYNRHDNGDPLPQLLERFATTTSTTTATQEDRTSLPVEERLKLRIIDGDADGLEADLDEALTTTTPLDLINNILLDGMKVVGELFGSGEMQLPFVLKSAETMKRSVRHLEPLMDRLEGTTKGRIVLGTVKGDVHDIGKNLVDIILTNNGYEVHNLGIKVAINEMIEKARNVNADMIGMSGLLVKSTLIMRDNLEELNQRNLSEIPVILGGAALNRTYVERDLREVYKGRVFYGRDAFEGLSTLDELMRRKSTDSLDAEWGRKPGGRNLPRREPRAARGLGSTSTERSGVVATDNPVFVPPFLGSRVERGIPIDEVAKYLNQTTLFRNQWQYRPEGEETNDAFRERIQPLLREALADAKRTGVLVPQVVYGYWPCNAEGNDLVIYDTVERSTELTRFTFPRQVKEPNLCIADFFRPLASGEIDYVAFQLVTMGAAVSERTAALFAEDRYQDYLTLHGLGVEMAEALAEYWHHRVRTEWGFVDEDAPSLAGLFRQQHRGGRYSWGYPACPELEDNGRAAALLGADRLGVVVNEESSWQFHPEQTTAAIICHHPQAKYFVAN